MHESRQQFCTQSKVTTHPTDACCARSAHSATPAPAVWMRCVACASLTAPRLYNLSDDSAPTCSDSSDWGNTWKIEMQFSFGCHLLGVHGAWNCLHTLTSLRPPSSNARGRAWFSAHSLVWYPVSRTYCGERQRESRNRAEGEESLALGLLTRLALKRKRNVTKVPGHCQVAYFLLHLFVIFF